MPSRRSHLSPPSIPKRERRSEAAGRALVAAWEASGLPQAVFARRRGVSAQRLSYWRLRLGQRAAAGGVAGFVEIPPVSSPNSGAVFVEVGSGIRVQVERGFDPDLLGAVVSALMKPRAGC
jgi:hypothetical protein